MIINGREDRLALWAVSHAVGNKKINNGRNCKDQHSINDSKDKQILHEVKSALPNMSETEEKMVLSLISEGYDTDDIIDRICFGGWLDEYIEQVMYAEKQGNKTNIS